MYFVTVLMLIFVRFTTIMMFLPIFNTKDLPSQVKVLFGLTMALLFFFSGNFSVVQEVLNPEMFLWGIVFEVINGLSVGMIILLITNTVYVTGQIIDMNIGFSIISVINPTGEDQMPITSNLYYIFLVIIFLLGNFHHMVILAFMKYLEITPLGALSFHPSYIETYTKLITDSIEIGVAMSLPILVTILIADIILGVLSKAMPGLNVFIIGMPFKILVGLMTLLVVFPVLVKGLHLILSRIMEYIELIIRLG